MDKRGHTRGTLTVEPFRLVDNTVLLCPGANACTTNCDVGGTDWFDIGP
jgi:hypothetical protein